MATSRPSRPGRTLPHDAAPDEPTSHEATSSEATASEATSSEAMQNSPEFRALRRTFRRFVVPATVFFLAWYFLYVLAAAFAPGFMTRKVWGTINVALVFGLLQFVTTFAVTMLYSRWARRNLDPAADTLRERMETRDPR